MKAATASKRGPAAWRLGAGEGRDCERVCIDITGSAANISIATTYIPSSSGREGDVVEAMSTLADADAGILVQ